MAKKLIPEKAKKASLKLENKLKNIQHCSLTCDGWTSAAGDSYMGKLHMYKLFKINNTTN